MEEQEALKSFKFPLRNEEPKFDYKLINQNGKLSEVPLCKEYQKLTLEEQQQKLQNLQQHQQQNHHHHHHHHHRVSNQEQRQTQIHRQQQLPQQTLTKPHSHKQTLPTNNEQLHNTKTRNHRKRNAGEDDFGENDSIQSGDDFTSSDTDSNTPNSVNSQVSSYRTKGLSHPPTKKRLTSNSEHISIDVNNQEQNNPNYGSLLTNNATFASSQSSNRHRPKTPVVINSPNNTPLSDIDEDSTQQLPLPSPSASPVQSDHEHDDVEEIVESPGTLSKRLNLELIESHMLNIPRTQSELINVMNNLSNFLTEQNHNNLIFRLLQKTNRSALSSFSGLLNNSLKRDLIGNLPLEISIKVLSYLDANTLLSISKVCKKWFKLVNNPELWINLLKKDKLITDENIINQELIQSKQLIDEWCTYPGEINSAQLLYKKRTIIANRWLDPKYQPNRISVTGHGNKVVTCLQHDEEKIVTGVDDKCILIYSTKTGKLMKVLEGHDGGVWALKYSGNTLVTGSTDRTVRVWNMTTGKCTHIFRGHTSTIRCLDIIHPTVIGKDVDGTDIVFPEFPLLVTGSRDHNIHVWRLPIVNETNSNIDETTFDGGETENPYLIAILSGHTQSVRSISGHGNIIISGSYDSTVRVWDLLDNGNCKHILHGHQDRVYSTAMDFNKKLCFSGSMDSTINIWNFETGDLLKVLEGHSSLVGLLALVDDVLVSAAADASLRIWDPTTGELKSKLRGHAAAITCFEHDGLKIVSGSEKMLKLWHVNSGTFARDLLTDVTGGVWQVRIDYKRCVAAVQRFNNNEEGETFIEILDFSKPLNK
ncbi:CDC4 [Candida pseudojiufengensis]|uniref:CDC4 n=1 Tax=Candida pseudojiufengensis TaxID=497109 RepID=UPI00222443D9|nr:CDC4 [Candida pseudojiufengensis]KAI5966827.1 CDC4 [Candida pseudojiufengensis]